MKIISECFYYSSQILKIHADTFNEIVKILHSHHFLYRITWKRIKEKSQKESHEKDEEDLENGPLVVVPDNVSDGFDGIQEPHE